METFKSKINRGNKEVELVLLVRDASFNIPLTKDAPNEIKEVFNSLIKELKKGEFNFTIEDSEDDLYFSLSKEYIKQLNSELSSVFKELEDLNLLDLKE